MNSMENTVRKKVDYVYSSERDGEWLFFRDSLQDANLMSVPQSVFIANMRAAYLQLVGGAMMKAMGGFSALRNRMPEVMEYYGYLEDAIKGRDPEIIRLRDIYNKAYGSSPNGIKAMVPEMNRRVTNGRMASRSLGVLEEHLSAVALSMLGDFSRADGGGTGQPASTSMQGSGCMLIVIGGIIGIAHLLY